MRSLDQQLNESLDLAWLEVKGSKPLPKTYLEALKHVVGSDFDPRDMFYNTTCLITTDYEDAKFLEEKLPNCKIMLKIESEYFSFGYYFINFIENKQLMNLIGGIQ